ncbi:hypothetical protein L596_005266 [Steinernema carpocapsae]|uniref:Phenazine biosynthesis-like domain-containing protein n=1 Tax=Steinernema carpocapsae TaxID=34508 RepID=A0A4U8UYK0_STECR|nr:hypothetical protein L596_005266 [Steinernema carpocapsae]
MADGALFPACVTFPVIANHIDQEAMATPVFIVDAFTNEKFCGNQAAVCLFKKPRSDLEYQRIGAEFNLSETAVPLPLDTNDFKTASKFSLRWFTPTNEVSLCGHATLATAHVLFHDVGNVNQTIAFESKSGTLTVDKARNGSYQLNFPLYKLRSLKFSNKKNPFANKFEEIEGPAFILDIVKSLGIESKFKGALQNVDSKKCILVIDENTTKEELQNVTRCPDEMLKTHPEGTFVRGVVVSFKPKDPVAQGFVDKNGRPYDYVSRYFAPWVGINEDPATGSSQCVLANLWSKFFEEGRELYAFQCYPNRGAQFLVQPKNDRLAIKGEAVTVIQGTANF